MAPGRRAPAPASPHGRSALTEPTPQVTPTAPSPETIFARSEHEGRRRLTASPLAQSSTGFVAGVNIVFAIVALGIVDHLAGDAFGRSAGELAGALAFGVGLTFLVVGRSDLFTENFLDPLTARASGLDGFWRLLARLWALTLVLNLVGGGLLALILTTEHALPEGAPEALARIASESARLAAWPELMNAIAGGALVALLAWLALAVESGFGRFAVAWAVGSLLALGPFEHVVVTVLHLFIGLRYDAAGVDWAEIASTFGIVTAGNLVGGILLVTIVRAGQARG